MTVKYDFKKAYKAFYSPKNVTFELIEIAPLRYLAIDGQGSPESEEFSLRIQSLDSTAYPLKFIAKSTTSRDYAIPPLEALWWADDYSAFTTNDRNAWKWTLLSAIPEWVTPQHLDAAVTKA